MNRSIPMILILTLLPGCNWVGRQADALGDHMPVIGERCEHWQCFTESGQARSNAVRAEKLRRQKLEAQAEEKENAEGAPPKKSRVERVYPSQ